MDTPTAMLMATTYGVATFGHRVSPSVGILCAVGALVPDLDTLLPGDTTSFITLHRGPTHSILFLLLATPAMAWIAKRLGAKVSFETLCAASALGLGVGIGSDLITWWGTVVLWPFTDTRFGWGLVFIIDLWHSLILAVPFLAWAVQGVRRKPLPRLAFRLGMLASVIWLALCAACHVVARVSLAETARHRDATALDVVPQPLSPFRWSLITETEHERRCEFIDLLEGGDVVEVRTFPKTAREDLVRLTDSTEIGRRVRWFHRNSHVSTAPLDAPDTWEVVYEDLSYQIVLPDWYGPPRFTPFRYRFVVTGDQVVEEGWIDRD